MCGVPPRKKIYSSTVLKESNKGKGRNKDIKFNYFAVRNIFSNNKYTGIVFSFFIFFLLPALSVEHNTQRKWKVW